MTFSELIEIMFQGLSKDRECFTKKNLLKLSSSSLHYEIASNTDCVSDTMGAVSLWSQPSAEPRVRWPPLAHIAAPRLWPSVSQTALFTDLYFSPADGGRSSNAGLGN